MTDKQITIDYENLCENYSKEVGCYNTFDGSCIKEQCFTYRLLQLLKAKEQECEELKIYIKSNEQQVKEAETLVMDNDRLINELDQLKQTLAEIKEIAEEKSNVNDWLALEILQKISECEVENE